jgi:hypothetical protein
MENNTQGKLASVGEKVKSAEIVPLGAQKIRHTDFNL